MQTAAIKNDRLLKRLRSLRTLELFNVLWVPGMLMLTWTRFGAQTWLFRSLSLVLVAYILLQGGLYWHLKASSLTRGQRRLPGYFAPLFLFARRSNVVLFISYIALLTVVSFRGGADLGDLGWGVGLFVFAVLEHVNNYGYQLMHDSPSDLRYLRQHRRLRRAALRQDLENQPSHHRRINEAVNDPRLPPSGGCSQGSGDSHESHVDQIEQAEPLRAPCTTEGG